MNIKLWVLNKLVQPVVPIIKQAVLVLDIVIAKIENTIEGLNQLGIKLDGTVLDNIKNAISAISIVRLALVKILQFVGETFGIESQYHEALASADLKSEMDKLKSLI